MLPIGSPMPTLTMALLCSILTRGISSHSIALQTSSKRPECLGWTSPGPAILVLAHSAPSRLIRQAHHELLHDVQAVLLHGSHTSNRVGVSNNPCGSFQQSGGPNCKDTPKKGPPNLWKQPCLITANSSLKIVCFRDRPKLQSESVSAYTGLPAWRCHYQ